jgi:hypothetical protein
MLSNASDSQRHPLAVSRRHELGYSIPCRVTTLASSLRMVRSRAYIWDRAAEATTSSEQHIRPPAQHTIGYVTTRCLSFRSFPLYSRDQALT